MEDKKIVDDQRKSDDSADEHGKAFEEYDENDKINLETLKMAVNQNDGYYDHTGHFYGYPNMYPPYFFKEDIFLNDPNYTNFGDVQREKIKTPKESKGKYKQRVCANCHTTSTPSWRRDGKNKTVLCNACGLYQKLHKKPRPFTAGTEGRLKTKTQKNSNEEVLCSECGGYFSSSEQKQSEHGNVCPSCIYYKDTTTKESEFPVNMHNFYRYHPPAPIYDPHHQYMNGYYDYPVQYNYPIDHHYGGDPYNPGYYYPPPVYETDFGYQYPMYFSGYPMPPNYENNEFYESNSKKSTKQTGTSHKTTQKKSDQEPNNQDSKV